MHELALVNELIEAVGREVANIDGHGRVLAVTLVIGPLSGASGEAIRFAYRMLAPGTVVEGARLLIQTPPLEGLCRACGTVSKLKEPFAPCPACDSSDLELRGESSVLLQRVELDDSEKPESRDR